MEQQQQHTKVTAASSSASSSGSSSSSSRSIRGSMSSAFLGVSSSSTHSQSQRRSSPSLYPQPAPLPGVLASRGSAAAASGGAASGSSSASQFHQISPSPGTVARRRPRPSTQRTHSLPTPFLTELSLIRRTSANIFGDLNANETRIQRPLLHGQQEQEMTRSSSSFIMPHSHHHTPVPVGESSGFLSVSQQQQAHLAMRGLPGPGFAPPPSQQQQAQPSFSSVHPLPGGNFSGFLLPASQPQQTQPSFPSLHSLPSGNFSRFPLPVWQPQHMQPSSSSSTDLPSRIFFGSEPPAASQHFSTLEPLPSGSTIFQSYYSSCSADHAQPLSSDSELPPLPPSLEIRQCDLPPLGQLSFTVDQSSSAFVQPSETSELAPLPESLQMPPLLLQQVKQEPVAVAPCLEPEIISLDDDDDGSSASLPSPMLEQPSNLEQEGMHRLQLGGSSSELIMTGVAEGAGVGQTEEATPMPARVHGEVNNGGGSSSSISWNGSQSEEKALQQLRNLLSRWSSTASSISSDQSMGSRPSSVAGSRAAMPALAKRFDMMSISGSSSSAGPEMPCNNSSLDVGAGTGSSKTRRGCTKEHYYFSEAEMEMINNDKRLKELMKTDSKRVKRMLRNRESVARLKLRKANQLEDLQCQADALKMECSSLSAQVQSHQEMVDKLRTENRAAQIKLKGLKDVDNLKQALNNQLQSELERLKLGS